MSSHLSALRQDDPRFALTCSACGYGIARPTPPGAVPDVPAGGDVDPPAVAAVHRPPVARVVPGAAIMRRSRGG
jgi:hypothetical protein